VIFKLQVFKPEMGFLLKKQAHFAENLGYYDKRENDMKKVITTTKAPAAIGPYSQAVEAGGFLYVSGQLPIDPATGKMAGDIGEQARSSLGNIEGILLEAGLTRNDVVKTTIFLKNLADFDRVNKVYGEFFAGSAFLARSTVEVARLPMDASIEIEAIAQKTGFFAVS
jgi:2-iminobutanoate/2-iminopropanoate deaminase